MVIKFANVKQVIQEMVVLVEVCICQRLITLNAMVHNRSSFRLCYLSVFFDLVEHELSVLKLPVFQFKGYPIQVLILKGWTD